MIFLLGTTGILFLIEEQLDPKDNLLEIKKISYSYFLVFRCVLQDITCLFQKLNKIN